MPFVGAAKSEEQIPYDEAVRNDKLKKGKGEPKDGGRVLEGVEDWRVGMLALHGRDVFRAFALAGKRLADV